MSSTIQNTSQGIVFDYFHKAETGSPNQGVYTLDPQLIPEDLFIVYFQHAKGKDANLAKNAINLTARKITKDPNFTSWVLFVKSCKRGTEAILLREMDLPVKYKDDLISTCEGNNFSPTRKDERVTVFTGRGEHCFVFPPSDCKKFALFLDRPSDPNAMEIDEINGALGSIEISSENMLSVQQPDGYTDLEIGFSKMNVSSFDN